MTDNAELVVWGIRGLPEIEPGTDLAQLIYCAMVGQGTKLLSGDIVVITQKIVSKAEGQVVRLSDVEPSHFALEIGTRYGKDPRQVEVVLREAKRIVRMRGGLLITETKHGYICANAGVDNSNVESGSVTLLPQNPDLSALRMKERLEALLGLKLAVIISDTWGRPWRSGIVNFAIGSAGINPVLDYAGQKDQFGYELKVTKIAVIDEIAALAELVCGKLDNTPVAIVRGYKYEPSDLGAASLLRPPDQDLFY
ncbi:MAG TPA: coenzyme F420-0:L-glutamate ligase [bacterium]|nr:coenzyme F420-0:L-glutamate ligase [bacterium]